MALTNAVKTGVLSALRDVGALSKSQNMQRGLWSHLEKSGLNKDNYKGFIDDIYKRNAAGRAGESYTSSFDNYYAFGEGEKNFGSRVYRATPGFKYNSGNVPSTPASGFKLPEDNIQIYAGVNKNVPTNDPVTQRTTLINQNRARTQRLRQKLPQLQEKFNVYGNGPTEDNLLYRKDKYTHAPRDPFEPGEINRTTSTLIPKARRQLDHRNRQRQKRWKQEREEKQYKEQVAQAHANSTGERSDYGFQERYGYQESKPTEDLLRSQDWEQFEKRIDREYAKKEISNDQLRLMKGTDVGGADAELYKLSLDIETEQRKALDEAGLLRNSKGYYSPGTEKSTVGGKRNTSAQDKVVKQAESEHPYSEDVMKKIAAAKGNLGGENQVAYFHGVSDKLLKNVQKYEEGTKEYEAAMAAYKNHINNGPGMSDWIYGNDVPAKAAGAAISVGVLNAIMSDGRRSNRDLYSSPF